MEKENKLSSIDVTLIKTYVENAKAYLMKTELFLWASKSLNLQLLIRYL